MDKNELNGRKVEHVIDINNRSLIKTDSSVQKEGSPAWFREQAAKTEHQYHLKNAEKIRENFVK